MVKLKLIFLNEKYLTHTGRETLSKKAKEWVREMYECVKNQLLYA